MYVTHIHAEEAHTQATMQAMVINHAQPQPAVTGAGSTLKGSVDLSFRKQTEKLPFPHHQGGDSDIVAAANSNPLSC
jgi:hypothetical protein